VIEIPAGIRDEIVSHALGQFPNEACGLLAGSLNGWPESAPRADRFFPMTNTDASPSSYRLDSKEQFQVFKELDTEGLDLVAIFHSHTHSEAFPSETDRKQAYYPDAHYLLVSLEDREHPVLRGFSIRDGEIEEQDVTIT
jgi:[CysO sulfur-carrier protein]-S-L-cysteine hydrolase